MVREAKGESETLLGNITLSFFVITTYNFNCSSHRIRINPSSAAARVTINSKLKDSNETRPQICD